MLIKKNETRERQNEVKRKKMRIGFSFTAILIALAVIFMSKKPAQETPVIPSFNKQGELTLQKPNGDAVVTVDIEIADDAGKREIGLMGRPFMAERQGMLFIFEEEHYASFWMRNTILSLDMLFVDKQGKIITIHKNTKPFSDGTYPATGLTLYVLEVNAGFSDTYGIQEGYRIQWKRN